MLAALRNRSLNLPKSLSSWKQQELSLRLSSLSTVSGTDDGLLNLQDVEKILTDVRADDVKVIPAKQRQREVGAKQMMLPSVQGQDTGKWVIIDSGKVIVHALDENARAYYNLEDLWTSEPSKSATVQDLQKAFVKVRRKNNSKKPVEKSA
ncbi:hypothetical protein KPL71_013125 [Citrus sinensis]|uniref:Uncharacterized protein n=1 Tax=Citrus sinensis TaxID=2711 RepID=A0ACB8LHE0_CITSI|nr:hypothetical protein KPL71_013125 [Citrus sinensis]